MLFNSTALLLTLATLTALVGMGWLALSQDNHWRAVIGTTRTPKHATILRALGIASLMVSFILCSLADHITMAVLVWFMLLATAAICIAKLLTWRGPWLAVLVLRRGRMD
ncbi:MAG: DUF3325 domain-containing protein [Marinagarivorans sp.]|nr:DUF3325 domain-containing protein [Marinagarivorans sp.]